MSFVQSVLIPKKFFTFDEATSWLVENGFQYRKLDETEEFFRFRQIPPEKKVSYRTLPLLNGIRLILGYPS